ncbi:histidine N-alpha-methyltransferase-like [Branchiostoma lanceolatum]|uniref:histidine N-alpha-methyltransferase-like n=1 Tax=Branchiostoma lanceolatum TaxID=7740 RepID=UPI00345253BE
MIKSSCLKKTMVNGKASDVINQNDVINHNDVPEELTSVVASLTSERRYVPQWYVYDTRGSEMCEELIQKSKTYKLWRHEYSILQTHADDIASKVSSPAVLVDLGSGGSSKTRLVIEAMLKRNGHFTFVPVDMAKDFIETCGRQLEEGYPGLTVEPFGGLYMDGVRHVAAREEAKLLLWLGNSFSNISIHGQVKMLQEIRTQLCDRDRLVLGMDLNADREALLQAYGDQWTPIFRDNMISRFNKDFEGNMNADKFEFSSEFVENPPDGDTPSYVVKYLSSSAKQRVHFETLGLDIDFEDGEKIYFYEGPNTSCKWNLRQLRRLAEKSGFAVDSHWTDDEENYCVICLAPADVIHTSV